jgi:hypothetical protein
MYSLASWMGKGFLNKTLKIIGSGPKGALIKMQKHG